MGLHVGKHYDGRLDVKDAADAVMKMLRRYYDDFGDWRIADYAYNAGAYGMAMASNYNTRPRAVEVMVDGDTVHRIRRRETVAELYAGEQVLPA